MFDYMPDSRQVVTGLQLSPPREAGSLTYDIMFHKNSYLLQGNEIIRLKL
jgi:hypothetical protein